MEIQLKTITPIWTGGIERQKMTRIQESSIIGSLRWWYEVIVRGLGGHACDPSKHKCKDGNYCDVCQVFGATGLRRKFRLEVEEGSNQTLGNKTVRIPSMHRNNPFAGGWYLVPGWMYDIDDGNDLILRFYPFTSELNFQNTIGVTLALIKQWGGLAAKNQLGYGVVELQQRKDDTEAWHPIEYVIPNGMTGGSSASLPSLTNFFFAKIRFKPKKDDWWKDFKEIKEALDADSKKLINSDIINKWMEHKIFPIAPILKNWLRYDETYKIINDDNHQNYVWGTIKKVCPLCYNPCKQVRDDRYNPDKSYCHSCRHSFKKKEYQLVERVASKIKISSAYQIPGSECWEIRIWGWVPYNMPPELNLDRNELLQRLYENLKVGGDIWTSLFDNIAEPCDTNAFEWREFSAPKRDNREYESATDFLKSLLSKEG